MPDRHGPYRNVRFILEIERIAIAGFSRCRLPTAKSDVIEYREGNERPTPRKLGGLNEYGPLVLEKGITGDSIALFEWWQLVKQGKLDEARRNAAVVLLDTEGAAGPRWEFRNTWLARYDAPKLNALDEDVAVERLEIVHEGFERVA